MANCISHPSRVRVELRERHDAGVVDQDVQRLVPGSGEAAHGVLVGQVQGAHRDLGVAGGADDAGGELPGCLRAPHGQDDLRPGRGQARAVSVPMPEPAPVTMARLPDRSTPSITSAAVEWRPNGVWKSRDMNLPRVGWCERSGGPRTATVRHRPETDQDWSTLGVPGPPGRPRQCLAWMHASHRRCQRPGQVPARPQSARAPRRRRRPGQGNRRVPGLRREEVAFLAGVSSDYYVRLEQGRDRHPSDQVLLAIARALQLDEDATAYLLQLAKPPSPRSKHTRRPEKVSDASAPSSAAGRSPPPTSTAVHGHPRRQHPRHRALPVHHRRPQRHPTPSPTGDARAALGLGRHDRPGRPAPALDRRRRHRRPPPGRTRRASCPSQRTLPHAVGPSGRQARPPAPACHPPRQPARTAPTRSAAGPSPQPARQRLENVACARITSTGPGSSPPYGHEQPTRTRQPRTTSQRDGIPGRTATPI